VKFATAPSTLAVPLARILDGKPGWVTKKVDEVIEAGSIGSENVAKIGVLTGASVAPSSGKVLTRVGGVSSCPTIVEKVQT